MAVKLKESTPQHNPDYLLEKRREYGRNYRKNNPEKMLKYGREYYNENNYRILKQRRKRHKIHPDIQRNQYLRFKYGFTKRQYDEMYERQEGKCVICHKWYPNGGKNGLCVDHDHKTGKVRSLLCIPCNNILGMVDDNIITLENAIQYIKSNQVSAP